MSVKNRTTSHDIETRSKDIIRSIINADGRGLFRELTERDYGIDAIVEQFDDGLVTGKFGILQCKGKRDRIEPLKSDCQFVSCSGISMSNIRYLHQDNTAVILVYASVSDRNDFYYADLKRIVSEEKITELENNETKKITVRIPISNNARNNMEGFFNLINSYYC